MLFIVLNNSIRIDIKKGQNQKLQLSNKVEITSDLIETLENNSGKVNLNFISNNIIDKVCIESTDGTVLIETVGNNNYTKEVELEYRKTYIVIAVTNDGNITQSKVKLDVFPITYNANNGSGETIKTIKVLGQNTYIKGNEFDVPSGYSFAGWSTRKNGTSIDYNAATTYTLDVELNLYAVWKCNGSTFTCNNGSTTYCNGTKSYSSNYCVTTHKWGKCNIVNGHWHKIMCKYCGSNKECSKGYAHPPCEHNKSSKHQIYKYCTHGYSSKHVYCTHNKYATHYYLE